MHNIQKSLIKRLVIKNHLHFGDLTRGYNADDNIVFHLKQLANKEYLRKRDNAYHLTKKGLEFSGSLNLETLNEQRFKSAYLAFVIKYKNKYLIRERISEPLRFYKFPGFKPLLGEPMKDARRRLFKSETGLELTDTAFKYRNTHFKIQSTDKNEVLFDDVLILYSVDISKKPLGNLKLREGNKWFSLAEIKKLKGKWPEIDLELSNKDKRNIYEYSFTNNYNIEASDL